MLTILTNPVQIYGSIGKLDEICFSVTSDETLSGRKMFLNPGLFVSSSGTTFPPGSGFTINYPFVPGVYDMASLNVSPSAVNYDATIEVVDSKNFNICFRYFFREDVNGYTGSPGVSNAAALLTGGSVYSGGKMLSLQLTDGLSEVYYDCPVSANFYTFLNYELSDSSGIVGGFNGNDLQVYFEVQGQNVSNSYDVQIFKMNYDGGGALPDAVDMEYATVQGGTITTVTGLNGSAFVSGAGIQQILGVWSGRITIDGSYFQSGFCYQLNIIYKDGAESKTARTSQICEDVVIPDPTYGDTILTYTDYDNVVASACVVGAGPGERAKVCFEMDKASYDSLAATNGVGTFDNNFKSVSLGTYVNSTYPFTAVQSPTFTITETDDPTFYRICAEFRIPESWSGETRYIIAKWVFKIGNHNDIIYTPFKIGVADYGTDITLLTFRDDQGNDLTEICHDLEGNVFACFSGLLSTFLPFLQVQGGISTNQEHNDDLGNFTQLQSTPIVDINSNCIEINPRLLALDKIYCFTIISKPATITDPPPSGDCDCFLMQMNQTLRRVDQTVYVDVNWETIGVLPDSVLFTTNGTPDTFQYIGESSEIFSFEMPAPANYVGYFIEIHIGQCTYRASVLYEWNGQDSIQSTFDICNPPGGIIGLGACLNLPTIDITCNTTTGEITAIANNTSVVSGVASQIFEVDDGSGFATYGGGALPEGAYIFKRVLTFSDGCPDIEITEFGECYKDPEDCDNEATLTLTYADPLLTLALDTSGVTSPIDYTYCQYSTDGGVTFLTYVNPIDTTGITEILLNCQVVMTDDCPALELSEVWTPDASTNCDYSIFTLECEYDTGTGTHIATFTGDESNLIVSDKQYSADGGLNWATYTTGVAGTVVLFRWVLQFEGCEKEYLFTGCAEPCDCCDFGTIDVNITNDCLYWGDCEPCDTFNPGTGGTIALCP